MGFSVHRENASSAISLLSGLSSLSGSSSTDTDIIYTYIYSQQLVSEIDAQLDLRSIWAKPTEDFFFAFDPDGKIEDLLDYWHDMVNVYYDSSTRLIEVRVRAFTPEEAQKITSVIYDKATEMINRLNDIAAEDTRSYARRDLDAAFELVVSTRQAMTAFRNKHQIVDPLADLSSQSSIIAQLQQELATTMIELDTLRDSMPGEDPRVGPLENRIRVIEARIQAEREKVGNTTIGSDAYANIVAEYERLVVDREFSETAYAAARAAFEAARAENRRQTRYLAAHVLPTLAESARHPKRWTDLSVVLVFLSMIWGIGALIFYSFRDRR